MDLVWIIFLDLELILGQGQLGKARCWDVSAEILFCLVWVYCLGFLTPGWVSQGWSPDPGRGKPDSPLQLPLISLNFTRSPPRTGNKVILRVLQLSDLKNRGVGYLPEASRFSFAAAKSAATDRGCPSVLYPLLKILMAHHPALSAPVSLQQSPPSLGQTQALAPG